MDITEQVRTLYIFTKVKPAIEPAFLYNAAVVKTLVYYKLDCWKS